MDKLERDLKLAREEVHNWCSTYTIDDKEAMKWGPTTYRPRCVSAATARLDSTTSEHGNAPCSRCRRRVFAREGVALMCGNPDHFHCNRCLHEMAETCLRLFVHKNFYGHENLRNLLPGMVLCSACLHPSLINFEETDVCTVPERPFDMVQTTRSSVDSAATNDLTYHVDCSFQNERRSLVGRFSKENLMQQDYRGAWSNDDGTVRMKGKSHVKCPNASYHWVSDWEIETCHRKGQEGWEYALNWPGEWSLMERFWKAAWQPRPTVRTLVRRRKWRRLRLRLSGDDCLMLSLSRKPSPYWENILSKMDEY